MKKVFILFLMFICVLGIAQTSKIPTIDDALKKYGFQEEKIVRQSDTIIYYLRDYNKKKTNPNKLVVFVRGTDPNPIFSYKINKGKTTIYKWFNNDYKALDSTYTYAIIPKPGLAGIFDENNLTVPLEYYTKNYRQYRVRQIHYTINHIIEKHIENPKKVILYGHSEGAVIAASCARENEPLWT